MTRVSVARRRARRLGVAVAAAVLAASLVGCGVQASPAAESGTKGDRGAGANAQEAVAEPSPQEFFDNLAVFRQMSYRSETVPSSWKTPPEGTWDEVDETLREQFVGMGEEVCRTGFDDAGNVAADNTDMYTTWLSARFLCPEYREAAETALAEYTSESTLEAMEYSVLRGNAETSDVLQALTLCEAAVELAWEVPAPMDKPYFCWAMRINAIAESDDEWDFISMFKGTGEGSPEFDALAEELGATPGGLSALLGVD